MHERLLAQRQALAALMEAIGANVKSARTMMRRMKNLDFESEIAAMEKISAKASPGKKSRGRARKTGEKKTTRKKGAGK